MEESGLRGKVNGGSRYLDLLRRTKVPPNWRDAVLNDEIKGHDLRGKAGNYDGIKKRPVFNQGKAECWLKCGPRGRKRKGN